MKPGTLLCDTAAAGIWLAGYLAATAPALGAPRWLQGLLWLAVAVLAARCSATALPSSPGGGYSLAAAAGLLYSALYILLGGMVAGLGRSPYLQDPATLLLDAALLAARSLGVAMVAYYLLARLAASGKPGAGLALAAAAVSAYSLNPARLAAASSGQPLAALSAASTAVASAASALLAGLVMLLGGGPAAGAMLLYSSGLAERLSPVLPDTVWSSELFTRLSSALAVYAVLSLQAPPSPRVPGSVRAPRLLAPLLAAAAVVWLSSGVLGVRLFAVTSSSMVPVYGPGDLLVATDPRGGVHVGDIVVYRGPQGMVAHRVVAVEARNGHTSYITKGDAVSRSDPEPVPASAIVGKVRLVVPLLGWPSLLAHRALAELQRAIAGPRPAAETANATMHTQKVVTHG